ncbi:MAG: RNA recognition motif domain-containing protein [Candidatus Aminicenantales bacterium]
MPVQIYAGNLSYKMTESDLREIFEEHGEVTSVKILKDNFTGRSRGFGFVEMPNQEEAEKAINSLNGKEVEGRKIRVNVARPKRGV